MLAGVWFWSLPTGDSTGAESGPGRLTQVRSLTVRDLAALRGIILHDVKIKIDHTNDRSVI
jgi:hypothetical protein